MTDEGRALHEEEEDLFEDAPCGYLTTRPDGTILRVNRTFERWTGLAREDLVERRRFQDLLTAGGRIYHETHYAPLLQMQGSVREIAVEIVRADGTRLPALVNSVLRVGDGGPGRVVRTTVFDATERRRYEQELLAARRREQEIAQRLQRSMLSGALPEAPGVELDVAYRPAVRGLEVGGDWYDAFWVDEGRRMGLVVGDVVGRGIDAAATMGQLRSALRALASTGLGPAALLDALDGYARRHEIGGMTTLVYAQLTLASGELRYACAGHPPPVLAIPGSEPSLAWDGRSTPLDADPIPWPRPEGSRTLVPGSTILLYTDGLIERRGADLDEGLDRLLREVGEHRDEAPAVVTSAVFRRLLDREHSDDVCLLAARLVPVAARSAA